MEQQALKVLVVDDHPVVRRGIVALLSSQDWVGDVFQASGVAEARDTARTAGPDLCVVDIRLPDGSGIEFVTAVKRERPATRCVVLSMEAETLTVQKALAAGADGYLVKDSEPDLLVDALRTAAHGGVVLGAAVARAGLQLEPAGVSGAFGELTPRELQIVAMIAAGDTNSHISRQLSLSEKTVRNMASIVLAKTGAKDRVQLALLARDAGVI